MTEDKRTATIQVRHVSRGPQAFIEVPSKRGGAQTQTLTEAKLSGPLAEIYRKSITGLAGIAVEFEVQNGQLQRVWEAGKTWDREARPSAPPTAAAPARPGTPVRPGGHTRPGGQGGRPGQHGQGNQGGQNRPGQSQTPSLNTGRLFENPYNFIPAPPRDRDHPSLGDRPPSGHHRYQPGLWSGRIGLELTTVTPLLIPDLGRPYDPQRPEEHKIFGLRVDEQGVPVLPPTSLKGALRVAYEAVTGSRLGVFTEHGEPLALRHPAKSGAAVVPVRVAADGEHLEILNGTTPIDAHGMPAGGEPQCAAWVPHYATRQLLKRGRNEVHHGRRVWARVQLWQHYRRVGRPPNQQWSGDFCFWRTLEIAPDAPEPPPDTRDVAPERPQSLPHEFRRPTFATPLDQQTRWVRGWIVVNGNNITRKHDERLFFDPTNGSAPKTVPLTAENKADWATLITSYREANERELRQGRACPSALPKDRQYEFSRHIREAGPRARDNRLAPGTLCYAALTREGGIDRVTALYPVMISRDLYARAPAALLGAHTAPAQTLPELSPADRVFGWVNQTGNGSYKGQLRLGTITCLDGAAAVERLGGVDGRPLAILGQPKPAQARFYAARTPAGEPLDRGVEKKQGYVPGAGLRGRKVYPHQRQAELPGYWDTAAEGAAPLDQPMGGRKVYREWQSPGNARSDQNRAITAWVKPGTRFCLDLDLINLAPEELGALLWLLTLGEGAHLRLGGGKPLGFGSVRLAIGHLDLATGEALAADYRAFGEASAAQGQRIRDPAAAGVLKDAYQAALPAAIGEPGRSFNDLVVIKAFMNAARGGTLPVHYPRTEQQQMPSGESYKWFVENEKSDRNRLERYSLPALAETQRGLPELHEN